MKKPFKSYRTLKAEGSLPQIRHSHGLIILSLILTVFGLFGCRKGPASAGAQTVERPAESQQIKKVLVLHSYHFEYEWVLAINRGISLVLSSVPTVEIQHFYMDTKRQTNVEWKQQVSAEVLAFIETWRPDVIIAADDNAQELVGREIAEKGTPAWVFCGVNNEAQKYGYPTKNVTGVLERPHLIESLEFFKKINPQVRNIVFLSDYSPTSTAVIEYCKEVYETNPMDMEIIDWVSASTLNEWKQTILKYNDQVDAFAIYTYHTLKSETSSALSVPPGEVMNWTTQNCTVPIVGFLTFAIEDGAFCGVFESGIEQGKIAGEMTLDILNGKSPEDIPIMTVTEGQTAINLNMAEKCHLNISDSILQDTHLIIGTPENEGNMLSY